MWGLSGAKQYILKAYEMLKDKEVKISGSKDFIRVIIRHHNEDERDPGN